MVSLPTYHYLYKNSDDFLGSKYLSIMVKAHCNFEVVVTNLSSNSNMAKLEFPNLITKIVINYLKTLINKKILTKGLTQNAVICCFSG